MLFLGNEGICDLLNVWSLQSDQLSAVQFIPFCSKSHFLPTQWKRNTKTKQPVRFQGFFKATNEIVGKWKLKKAIVWRNL